MQRRDGVRERRWDSGTGVKGEVMGVGVREKRKTRGSEVPGREEAPTPGGVVGQGGRGGPKPRRRRGG